METATTTLDHVALHRSVQFPILVGLRGVGKTVLLGRIKDLADARGYLAIDAEAHEGESLPKLLVPGIRKSLFALSGLENAKEKARRGLRVLKAFLAGLKVSVAGIKIALMLRLV